ncbi:MAG TPA: hypothetical protein VG389_03060 [Myxococcota bacterium]|nr:hypothetical protein [Myxococcota bacterium]
MTRVAQTTGAVRAARGRRGLLGAAILAAAAPLAAALVLAAGLQRTAGAGSGVALRYGFKAGAELTYAHAGHDVMTVHVAGADPVRMEMDEEMTVVYAVKAVGPGGIGVLTSRIPRWEAGLTGKGERTPVMPGIDAVSFDLTVAPDGKVGKVVSHGVPADKEDFRAYVEALIGTWSALPDKPVTPGATWKDAKDIPTPFVGLGVLKLHYEVEYALARVETIDGRPHAVVEGHYKVSGAGDSPAGLTMSASGDGTETSKFDVPRGRYVGQDSSFKLRVTLTGAGGAADVDIETTGSARLDHAR